jgi:AcrR family transcriptional regulator
MHMSEPSTRDRLLDEAEALFADRGYEGVSVREIATAAEANLAAVNYHFQGKENLYHEVLRRRIVPKRNMLVEALERVEGETDADLKLELLFRSFISVHLDDALRGSRGADGLRLLSREMGDPRHGAHIVLKELIGPVRDRVLGLMEDLLPELDLRKRQLLMGSVVSQVIYFAMNWHNLQANTERFGSVSCAPMPAIADDLETYITTVIDHVTTIAVAGAEAMRKEAGA